MGYAHRLPFLVNMYTPDINFGKRDPKTGGLQLFEKLSYPRNSDQSGDDICFQEKRCQYQISQLMKAANPRLKDEFKEAFDFYNVYSIPTTQLNLLVSKFLERENGSGSVMEKWLNATCDWMKDPASQATWNRSSWHIDIVRNNCLNGCGVETAEGSGVFVGGSCDYHTGQCVCDYPELFNGINDQYHCSKSCPGLVGPINGEFEWCGGHGSCDIETTACLCDEGYGDSGCTTKYQFYDFLPLTVVVCVLSGILAIIGIACIVWLRSAAEYKTVKALSVNMTTLMTIGIIFITSSNIALSVPVNSVSCIAWQWLFGLGGILAIMAPLLKAYRVSRVFHGGKMLRAVKITDAMLMSSLIKAAIAEAALCVGYSFAHQWYGGTETYFNHLELRTEERCNNYFVTSYLSLASYAFFFCILIMLTYYSWGTRRALAVFKESTCAYFSSFLSLLCTLITFTFYMVTDDPAFRIAVQSACITLVIGAVFTLFYATRIYAFFAQPENRNVTDARGASHASTHSVSSVSQAASVMKPGPNTHS